MNDSDSQAADSVGFRLAGNTAIFVAIISCGACALVGGGGTVEGSLLAALLNPIAWVGFPLGLYWRHRANAAPIITSRVIVVATASILRGFAIAAAISLAFLVLGLIGYAIIKNRSANESSPSMQLDQSQSDQSEAQSRSPVEVELLVRKHLSDSNLTEGDRPYDILRYAVPVSPPVTITEGDLVHLDTEFTILRIEDDCLLVDAEGVKLGLLHHGSVAELKAKLGDANGRSAPMDEIFLVGKARRYGADYAIPIAGIPALLSQAELKRIIEDVRGEKILTVLTHKFTDNTGNFKVEAVVVAYEDSTVEIVRVDNGNVETVPIRRFSQDGIQWVGANHDAIRSLGEKAKRLMAKKHR